MMDNVQLRSSLLKIVKSDFNKFITHTFIKQENMMK